MSEIIQPRDLSYDHASFVEEIFKAADEYLFDICFKPEGQEKLHANYSPVETEISESDPER